MIPADEWLGEVSTTPGIANAITGLESAVFDSVTNQKRPIVAYHTSTSGAVKALLTAFSSVVDLSQNKSQRMYFMFNTVEREETDTEIGERSSPWTLAEVEINAEKKYLSLRGSE